MASRLPRLIAISDRRSLSAISVVDWASRLAGSGVDGLQIREKDLDDRELFELCGQARRSFPAPGCLVINGRLDIALASAADGVHLPADGVPVAALRRHLGSSLLIGRSTHRSEEAAVAAAQGADYVFFGPVFATPSKAGFGAPLGADALRRAVDCGIPVFALGGLTAERLAEVAEAGAAGVAGIRLFQDLPRLNDLAALAKEVFKRP